MALPSPNLDDRRFQQLVDEAKRYVQQRAPEWTDHNVSDPGVTLIETFAYLVDQLLYRLNRVPDKNYLAFLDLLGIQLYPPSAATADVDFWLSAPQPDTVTLPAGTEVTTAAGETEEAVVFATTDDLRIVPSELTRLVAAPRTGGKPTGPARSPRAATYRASRRRPSPATPCSSACRRRCRAAWSRCAWTAASRASVSTRASPRWCGRRGTAAGGSAARRTPTAPAA